jgi:DNA end-binding protein Ku
VRSEKAYALLTQAMLRTNKVAIARFVMRTKQYLAALRPAAGTDGPPVLVLSTMLYADEVVPADRLDGLPDSNDADLVSDRELTMAQSLIDSLTASAFEPEKFHDTYRERVLALIDAKAAGETLSAPAPVESGARVVDLMAALEASVKAAKERRAAPAETDDATSDAEAEDGKATKTRRRKSA